MYQPDSAPMMAPKPSDWTSSMSARLNRSPTVLVLDLLVPPVFELAPAAGDPEAAVLAAGEPLTAGVAVVASDAPEEGTADPLAAALATALATALAPGVGDATLISPVVFEKLPTFNPTKIGRAHV